MSRQQKGDPGALSDAAICRRLGARILELRNERGLSQEAVAERGGTISYKHVGQIERAQTNPSATALVRIAVGLGVTVGELFTTVTPDAGAPAHRRAVAVLREISDVARQVGEELSRPSSMPHARVERRPGPTRRSRRRR